MEDKKIIMRESDEAATFRTGISGWVSSTGRFFGNGKDAERMARYDGSTHHLCDCGKPADKMYTCCDDCRRRHSNDRYNALPFVEWDGVTPLTEWDGDKYFFSEEDIAEYCADNEMKSSDLMLVVCEPNYLRSIDEEIWQDELPEDGELPPAIEKIVKELNEAIKKQGPVSWSQGKKRTSVEIEVEN